MDTRISNWSSEIESGLPTIDQQHRQLFDLAATFRGQGDNIRVMKTLAMLCDYANTHLREEEEMLLAIGYAGLEEHKAHHAEFRRMLRELLSNSRNMTLDQIANEVELLINGWFYQHVLKVDALYVPMAKAYTAKQAGSPPKGSVQ